MATAESLIIMSLVAVLQMSPVFSVAAFGQLLSQRSGVYNLGIEGIMAASAVFAVFGAYLGLGSWLLLFVGFVVGTLFGMLLSVLSVRLKLDQIVVGLGLWLVGLGLAGSIYTVVLAPVKVKVQPIGAVLFGLDSMFFLSLALFAFLMIFFSRTKWGLIVTAVGENPRVADSAGINVERVRAICNTVGAGLMGLAGAYLAVDVLQGFTYTIVAGYGWIAFALVIFGRWKPSYVFLGSLLFVSVTALSTRMSIIGIRFLPPNYVVILPHIAVLVVLTVAMKFARETGMPAALGRPYIK